MDLLNSFSFDSTASDDSGVTQAKQNKAMTTSTTISGLDWVDETVNCIARLCNLCGDYEIQQVGYEWMQEQQKKQRQATLNTKDLEVEVYRRFLFDESSVGSH